MAESDEVDPQAPARPRGRRRSAAAANVPAPRVGQEPEPEAEPEGQPDIPVRGRGRRRAAEPAADVPAEPAADVPADPAPRVRRGARAPVVAQAEEAQAEEAQAEAELPRRRGGLRGLRNANAIANREENANALIGPDEGEEGGEGEEAAGGAMGMIAQMLQGTVNFLKTDPIKETYDGAREQPPYPALKGLYERVKENPDDQDVIEEASTTFTELKNGFQPEGCDTDINIAMKQRCAGVKAGLYLGLYDIRKSVDESLKQMRPIQQPGVLRRIDRAARPEYEVTNNDNKANVFVPADL